MRSFYPDADILLVPSSGGIFDVEVDGICIFSKSQVNRFPNPGELSALLRENGYQA
ncbi:MAG: Rdx family protein [Sulfurospirillum sp.]|nr:Rdx family protein [Sulfurospirillum sp.]